jgi:hypothetical protein
MKDSPFKRGTKRGAPHAQYKVAEHLDQSYQTVPAHTEYALEVAGISIDLMMFVFSLVVVLVFLATTIQKIEDAQINWNEDSAIGTVVSGVIWVSVIMFGGGGIMENVVRAGLVPPG